MIQNKLCFDELLPIIETEINKRKYRWRLSAITWLDFDDVKQIILSHIYQKLHLFDPNKRDFVRWVNRVISNQLINLNRNIFTNFASPCERCEAAMPEHICGIYGAQECLDCPIYKKWHKTKRYAKEIKIPKSIEDHSNEVHSIVYDHFDFQAGINKLSKKLKIILKPIEWKVYKLLYIDNKSESQVASMLGYKKSANDYNRCKRIRQIRKLIIEKARKALSEGID